MVRKGGGVGRNGNENEMRLRWSGCFERLAAKGVVPCCFSSLGVEILVVLAEGRYSVYGHKDKGEEKFRVTENA